MFSFSEKLIADTRAYFLATHAREISVGEAESYLLSFSKVYLTFAKVEARRDRAEGDAAPQGQSPAAPLT